MAQRTWWSLLGILALVAVFGFGEMAEGATIKVPKDFPTIQDAVNNASPNDKIRVGHGEWCGATIDKPLDLFGEGGATIVGCVGSPNLLGYLRIGFFLPNAAASGTTIRHFVFDGEGVSDALPSGNFDPLSFAIFSRDASDIIIEQNSILGTVQAITNTGGSGWTVGHNVIADLTVFTCGGVPPCGGGAGIVFQERDIPGPRATDNSAMFNEITGIVPDDLTLFSMAGIIAFGQDGIVIKNNRISIPDNPLAAGAGVGIEVSDSCCGSGGSFLTTINSFIAKNDGRGSEV